MPACFEQVREGNEIALNIDLRRLEAVAHPGLGRHVEHRIEPILTHAPGKRIRIAEVKGDRREPVVARQTFKPRALERQVIVRRHVIDTDNRPARLQQMMSQMVANEAGHSRNQYGHTKSLSNKAFRRYDALE